MNKKVSEDEIMVLEKDLEVFYLYKSKNKELEKVIEKIDHKKSILSQLGNELHFINDYLSLHEYLYQIKKVKPSSLSISELTDHIQKIITTDEKLQKYCNDNQTADEGKADVLLAASLKKAFIWQGISQIDIIIKKNKFNELRAFMNVIEKFLTRDMINEIQTNYLKFRKDNFKMSMKPLLIEDLKKHYKIFIAMENNLYQRVFNKTDLDQLFLNFISVMLRSVIITLGRTQLLEVIQEEESSEEFTLNKDVFEIFKYCVYKNLKLSEEHGIEFDIKTGKFVYSKSDIELFKEFDRNLADSIENMKL